MKLWKGMAYAAAALLASVMAAERFTRYDKIHIIGTPGYRTAVIRALSYYNSEAPREYAEFMSLVSHIIQSRERTVTGSESWKCGLRGVIHAPAYDFTRDNPGEAFDTFVHEQCHSRQKRDTAVHGREEDFRSKEVECLRETESFHSRHGFPALAERARTARASIENNDCEMIGRYYRNRGVQKKLGCGEKI